MSALAVNRGGHVVGGRRILAAAVALLGVIGLVALALFATSTVDVRTGDADLDDPWAPWSRPVPAAVSPDDAISTWLVEHRAELFPGYDAPFIGRCPTSTSTPTIGLCTAPVENLGDHRIDLVGAYASDWGADLLLEQTSAGWTVIDAAPWPELGTATWFGPPWSPQTSIARWWATEQRAEHLYGAGAVHLRSCAEATEVFGPPIDQPLLCSTLVEDPGSERTYTSGRVGEPPDVELVLREEADHTWSVVETRALTR